MNKLLPILLLSIIIVTACNSSKKSTVEKNTLPKFDSNVIIRAYNGSYGIAIQQNCINCGDCYVTFYDNVYLYAKPDTNSYRIDTLSFNTVFDRQYFDSSYHHQNIDWLKIKYKDKYAFINHRKLVTIEQNIINPTYSRSINYLVGEMEYDSNLGRQIAIKKYDTHTNKILSEIALPQISNFHLSISYSSTLNGYDPIIYYRTSLEACPGTTYEAFIVDNGEELVKLADGTSEGEGIYYDVTSIYIPVRFNQDSIILATYIEPKNHYYNPYWSSQYHTIPYPKDIGVPIENLIVKFSEAADEDTNWLEKPYTIYEKVGAYEVEDPADQEYLYVHKRDTQYFEYKDGVVTPIEYPEK